MQVERRRQLDWRDSDTEHRSRQRCWLDAKMDVRQGYLVKCSCSEITVLQSWYWNELPCKTQPFETVAEKYSSSNVGTISLTGEKIFTVIIPYRKPQRLISCIGQRRDCSNQEERHDQTLVHTINVRTVTDGISRRVTDGREYASLILVDHGVEVIEGCYCDVMLW